MSDPSVRQVTFMRAFRLPGMDAEHAAGTFDVVVEQTALDVWWPAYRNTSTIMLTTGMGLEAWPISQADLDAALAADRAAPAPRS